MAQSPFQTSGNVSDIAPVALKGGFSPDTGIADAVVQVANIAIPQIVQNLEDDITEGVSAQIKAVSEGLQAVRFPSIQDRVFSTEALANPNVKMALKEFTLIQDAAANGRLPQTFVLERLVLIQNKAIKDSPEFEAEIRAAMRDATGQDPAKTLFAQLMSPKANKATAQQKAQEQLEIEAIKMGTSVDKVIAMNQSAAANQQEQQRYDLASKRGSYNLNTMSKDVASQGASIVTNTMAEVHQLIVAGGSFDVDTKRNLIARVDAAFGAANASLLGRMSGQSVSGSAIQAEMAPLSALRDNTIKMIEDNTMMTVLKQYNGAIVETTINNLLNNPDYVMAYSIGGSRGFVDMVKWVNKAGGTAEGKALVASLNADAKIGFDLQNIPKAYSQIGGGVDPETKQAKQERVIAAGIALSTTGIDPEFQMVALEEIRKHGGEDLTWSTFGSNKVLQATAQSSPLKAAFINMQVSTTAGLSNELLQLAANPKMHIERMELTATGKLHLTSPEGAVFEIGQGGSGTAVNAEMELFISRFNRANEISAKYNGAGVLPSARYSGSQMYWDTVKAAAIEVTKPREKANEVRKVIIGTDGKLTFDGGS